MSPSNKFHIFVASSTITVMFWVLHHFHVSSLSGLNSVSKLTIAYIGSAGFYQLLATALRWLLDHFAFARRLTLGPDYVEGTWIGCYKTDGNENRLTVEHFEQTLDGLTIRGYAFTETDAHPLVNWTSTAASVDGKGGTLTFSYECSNTDYVTSFQGIAKFAFERKGTRNPPEFLNGYSADLIDGKRSVNRERNMSRKQIALPTAWQAAKDAHLC